MIKVELIDVSGHVVYGIFISSYFGKVCCDRFDSGGNRGNYIHIAFNISYPFVHYTRKIKNNKKKNHDQFTKNV